MKLPWSGTTLIQNGIPRTSGFWLLGVYKSYRGNSYSYQRHIHALQLKQRVASTQSGTEFTHHIAFLPAPRLDLLSHKNELSIGRQSIMASVLTSMPRTETVVAGPSFSVVQLER